LRTLEEKAEAVTVSAQVPGHFVFGSWKNVLITYWQHQANGAAVKQLVGVCDELVKAHPGGVSIIHLVREGAGLPDAAAREGLARMGDRFAHETACLVVVLMGAGFWASALQSVLTGIRLIAPPRPSLMRFARDLKELESWFAQEHLRRSGVRVEPAKLTAMLLSLCSTADAGAPLPAHSAAG
jgi:hypothetical protein